MKRVICFLVALAVLSVPVLAVQAITVNWDVADEKVRPGGQTTVDLTLSNPSASSTPENINVFVTSGPYLTVTPSTASIASLGIGATQKTVLDVKVSNNAVSTTNYVTVKVTYIVSGNNRDTLISIPIRIRRDPILKIENISYTRTPEPGVSTILSFDIYNTGEGAAEELKVMLNQTSTFASTDSTGEMVLTRLGNAAKIHVEFPITLNPDAEPGIYSIPITLSYYDETKSDLTTETKHIGLSLSGNAKFIATLDRTENFYIGRKGTASVSVANVGTVPAEFLTIRTGGKEMYIGSLEPDDTEIIDIEQDLTKAKEAYPMEIELSWKDKFGNEYSETKEITVTPEYPPIDIPFGTIFFLLLIGGGAYWWFKKRKK